MAALSSQARQLKRFSGNKIINFIDVEKEKDVELILSGTKHSTGLNTRDLQNFRKYTYIFSFPTDCILQMNNMHLKISLLS